MKSTLASPDTSDRARFGTPGDRVRTTTGARRAEI
jgi:hypothetical protein